MFHDSHQLIGSDLDFIEVVFVDRANYSLDLLSLIASWSCSQYDLYSYWFDLPKKIHPFN